MKRNKEVRKERIEYINKLEDVICPDCSMKWPTECMDFDHLEDDKHFDIATKISAVPWNVLLAEIAKCEIICSNCHRIRTKKRRVV